MDRCGVTKKDKTRNEHVRGSVKVSGKEDHREKVKVVQACQDAPVSGRRQRGRQKTRWKESCKSDMESGGGRTGQDKVVERISKSFRRSQIMGKPEKTKLQQLYLYCGQSKHVLQLKFLTFHNTERQKPEE